MRKTIRGNFGYTLLEILVVIGIIAVLIGIGAVSYSSIQKKARDAKRKGDLSAIQNALEQYYSNCGYAYPTPDTASIPETITCTATGVVFMDSVPEDPLSSAGSKRYPMTQAVPGEDYTISAPATTYMETEDTFSLSSQQ